jgi:hypothetical protein
MFIMGEDPLSQSTGLSGKRKNKSYFKRNILIKPFFVVSR